MTNQTPAPDGEWLYRILSSLRIKLMADWENSKTGAQPIQIAKIAILQEIQNHDRQLLDRIDGNLPEPENFGNGFNDLVHLDDVKAIINQERGKL